MFEFKIIIILIILERIWICFTQQDVQNLKCCSSDDLIDLNFNNNSDELTANCIDVRDHKIYNDLTAIRLNGYYLNYTESIPVCKPSEKLAAVKLIGGVTNVSMNVECFDSDGLDFYGLYCSKGPTNTKHTKDIVLKLRKCCTQDFYYNENLQKCENSNEEISEEDSDEYHRMVEKSIIIRISKNLNHLREVLFTEEPPACDPETEALVVYKFKIEDLFISSDLKSIKLRDKFTVNMESTSYCLDNSDKMGEFGTIHFCTSRKEYCKNHPCVNKCCKFGQTNQNRVCMDNKQLLQNVAPKFYDLDRFKNRRQINLDEFGLVVVKNCLKIRDNEIRPLNHKTGELLDVGKGFKYGSNKYCIELEEQGERNSLDWKTNQYLCAVDEQTTIKYKSTKLLSMILMMVSCVCLTLALIVYGFLPQLRNVHGRILIGTMITILLTFILICNHHLGRLESNGFWCQFHAYWVYFGLMSILSWFNLLSVDLYVKISTISKGFKKMRQLLFYSAFPITLPLFLTCLLFVMKTYNFVQLGESRCFFDKNKSLVQIFLFIVPSAIQVFFNWFLFIGALIHYNNIKKRLNKFRKCDQEIQKNNLAVLHLSWKIGIVMGLPWTLEVFLHIIFNVTILQVVGDTLNTLQGVFIFMIFVCKPNILNSLRIRLGWKKKRNVVIFGGDLQSRRTIIKNEKVIPMCLQFETRQEQLNSQTANNSSSFTTTSVSYMKSKTSSIADQ